MSLSASHCVPIKGKNSLFGAQQEPTATRTAANQNDHSKSRGHFLCKPFIILVPGGGVEPPREVVSADFESAASASSAIPAEEGYSRQYRIAPTVASPELSWRCPSRKPCFSRYSHATIERDRDDNVLLFWSRSGFRFNP